MKARIVDFALTFSGKQRLTLELDEDFRHQYDELHDYEVNVEVKKYRKKRSLDANAYCWVLIDKIAQKIKLDKAEVYKRAIRRIGGVSTIVCVQDSAVNMLTQSWENKGIGWQTDILDSKIPNCTNVVLYYGSSVYDTQQMADFIDSLVQEAKALNIETLTPDKIQLLKGEYRC